MKSQESEAGAQNCPNVQAHRHAAGENAAEQNAETNIAPQLDAAQNSGVFGAAPCSLPGVDADSDWVPPIMGDF